MFRTPSKIILCTITSQIKFRCTMNLLNLKKSKGQESMLLELNIEGKCTISSTALESLMARNRKRIFQLNPFQGACHIFSLCFMCV